MVMRGGWDIVRVGASIMIKRWSASPLLSVWIDGQLTCLVDTDWGKEQHLQRLVQVRGKSFVSSKRFPLFPLV